MPQVYPHVSIELASGSIYIGSPIVYSVTPTGVSDATLYRVCLDVAVQMTGQQQRTFKFSSPCNGITPVLFDISSALRAVADLWQPSPMDDTARSVNYPVFTYTMTAYEEYMLDGMLIEGANRIEATGDTVYLGELTDYERRFNSRPTVLSRKPRTASPEVVLRDFGYIFPSAASAGTHNAVRRVPTAADVADLNLYVGEPARDSYEIQFVNSLGVHENVFVSGLPSTEVKYETTRHVISRPETLTEFSRGISIKRGNHERWKMSTGPLDRQWQQWYLHEFLKARWAWIGVTENGAGAMPDPDNQVYLPIHILPDDTSKGVDRKAAGMLTVDFTIEFDFIGSPY